MKKVVNYKVSGEEWKEAKDKAFEKVVKKVKVDGFRNGKVPRAIFEKKYGTGEIISEAMEDMVDKKYKEIILNDKIIPVVEPKLEIVGADDNGFEVNMTFITNPEVTLGKYTGLKAKKEEVKVTKEEIDHEVDHILDKYAELVSKDGKAENGDTVIIDFKGFKDDKEFEGGSAENYSLELGSHSFIPGFEEAVVGMSKDEEKDIPLTFPKDYMAKDLAGQKVVFNVKVHDIKKRVIPELDEEFFKDLDMEGVTNKEELYKAVEEELKVQKDEQAENIYTEKLLEEASNNMKVDIDKEIIDDEAKHMYEDFTNRLKGQGISEELYYAYAKTSKEDVMKDLTKEAEVRLRYRYLLEAIIKEEKITVSDKEAKDEVKKMAKEYNMTEEHVMEHLGSLDQVKFELAMKKALDVLKK